MTIIESYLLPGLPHPLLCPNDNPGYARLKEAFLSVRRNIEKSEADVLLIYSTMWPSVIGHQIQSRENPTWVHVDELFHDLGSIPYSFKIDSELADEIERAGKSKGLECRTINYHGFPIDTGSVTALKLINPDNRIPAVIFSSNVYADRAETIVFGKSISQALEAQGKKAVAIIVSTLSNRLHQEPFKPSADRIHSLKDEEWNQKIIELLNLGRLEDVAQLSRQIHKEARVHKVNNFKSFWWLSSLMGAHNRYSGNVLAYEPVCGTGCAVAHIQPALHASRDLEYDEDSPDYYSGDRNVLSSLESLSGMSSQSSDPGIKGD